jgi:hypothetical protein
LIVSQISFYSFLSDKMALNMGLNAVGGDPRYDLDAASPSTAIHPQHRLHHDINVTFEEYHYYALKTRAVENEEAANDTTKTGILQILFPPKRSAVESTTTSPPSGIDGEKGSADAPRTKDGRLVVSDAEWINASRALRTATWAACFYLITTDILGPFGVG